MAICVAGAVMAVGFVAAAPPSMADGEGWAWCDTITVRSTSSSRTPRVTVTGYCDGGRVSLTGTLKRSDGTLGLRGNLGGASVRLGANIGTYTYFTGSIGGASVEVDGYGSRGTCDLSQTVDGSLTPVFMVGNLFNRMCPILNGLVR
jgi:hypothetical protein